MVQYGMRKTQAIDLLGGAVTAAAGGMGITYQAVNQWPDVLPNRIADRVLGACLRLGVEVPSEFIKPKQPQAPALKAQAATETVAQGVAHG